MSFRHVLTAPLLLLLSVLAGEAAEGGRVTLPDGRSIPFVERRRVGKDLVLKTVFGELRFPAEVLDRPAVERKPSPRPGELRKSRSKWFALETDLPEDRAEEHRDTLDAFFEWMLGVYGLDREKVRDGAPYRIVVYSAHEDFRTAQSAHVEEVSRRKGKAFGEGLAGFFTSGSMSIFLWATDPIRSGHLEVAKHETTHLLNHLLARERGLHVPVWFEEGTAVYFSAAQGSAGKEPGDLPAALATIAGELRSRRHMENRQLRSTAYGDFLGREYTWGWALIRYVRRHRGGAGWDSLLAYLRTASGGSPSEEENRRFLEALSAESDAALDESWLAHLRKAVAARGWTPLGATPEALREVEALEKPTRVQARDFLRVGESFLRINEPAAAAVYLRAAMRGGVVEPAVLLALAEAIARKEGLATDQRWPPESLDLLGRAVAASPLDARSRFRLGEQLLLQGREESAAAARDMLGLAYLTMRPDDDRVGIAISLLSAARAASAPLSEEGLVRLRPDSREVARAALPYHLQAEGLNAELMALLEARVAGGEARRWERKDLAKFLRGAGRAKEAVRLFRALLEEDGEDAALWLPYIRSLLEAGMLREAVDARSAALRALDRRAGGAGWIRRQIEKLEIR